MAGQGVGDAVQFLRITIVDLAGLVLRVYLFAPSAYCVDEFRVARRLRSRRSLLSQLCEPILKPVRRMIPADRSDRFLGALGVDRDRRPAGAGLR